MQINESFRKLIPPLSSEEYAQLEENCKADGIRDPLVVWRGTLIDGHNRYDIAQKHGLEFQVVEKDFEDENHVKIWMIRNQKGRRNLTDGWKYMLAEAEKTIQTEIGAAIRKATEGRPKQAEIVDGNQEKLLSIIDNSLTENPSDIMEKQKHNTRKKIAESLGWSTGKVAMADRVFKSEKPEIKAAVLSGEKSINEAYKEIKKVEIEAKRDEIRETLTAQYLETGEKKYRVIYADPPWKYGNAMPEYVTTPEDHYPAMSTIDICAMPINDICENDAVLFLWTTSPHLEETFEVIKAWGFKYKTSFVWDKVKHNMGHYNSVRHEFLLVCTKGSCVPDVKKLFDSVVTEERTTHSKKPETFREIIDTIYTDGNRIELFARNVNKEGWDVYGNQS